MTKPPGGYNPANYAPDIKTLEAIVRDFPHGNSRGGFMALRGAVNAMACEFGEDHEAAAQYLLGRVRAYAASRLAKTTPVQFRTGLTKWCYDECYRLSDDAWAAEYADKNTKKPVADWGKV